MANDTHAEQIAAAEALAVANPEWTWHPERNGLSLGSGYGVSYDRGDNDWVAFRNGFIMVNGLEPIRYATPREAILAMGFRLASED